jgi:beta-glucosidase
MAFYDRLIDGLLERDITPNLTLYHWDLPSELQAIGGWTNPKVVDLFAEYAAKMSSRYGDRVKYWATMNEPWCVAWLGNLTGEHAPGIRDLPTAVRVAHQLVRAHALGSQAIKSQSPKVLVGAVNNLTNPMLIGEATKENLKDLQIVDAYKNRWWMQGMYEGKYPADLVEIFERETGIFCDENEIGDVSFGRDWIGLNYYNADVFTGGGTGVGLFPGTSSIQGAGYGTERTDMGWSWTPDGIKTTLIEISQKYPNIPVFVSENGSCYNDGPSDDGKIHDAKRDEYLSLYIKSCVEAYKSGVNLKGYYLWSLLDNFEWAWGFEMRFGLVHVDFGNNMKRTPKESALGYRDLIRSSKH